MESFISRYENHFDARRSTDEETSNQEFEIAVNAHCETVVSEAMDLYWRSKSKDGLGDWHFVKTSVVEKLKKYDDNSPVLHRMLNQKNNLHFKD